MQKIGFDGGGGGVVFFCRFLLSFVVMELLDVEQMVLVMVNRTC